MTAVVRPWTTCLSLLSRCEGVGLWGLSSQPEEALLWLTVMGNCLPCPALLGTSMGDTGASLTHRNQCSQGRDITFH